MWGDSLWYVCFFVIIRESRAKKLFPLEECYFRMTPNCYNFTYFNKTISFLKIFELKSPSLVHNFFLIKKVKKIL